MGIPGAPATIGEPLRGQAWTVCDDDRTVVAVGPSRRRPARLDPSRAGDAARRERCHDLPAVRRAAGRGRPAEASPWYARCAWTALFPCRSRGPCSTSCRRCPRSPPPSIAGAGGPGPTGARGRDDRRGRAGSACRRRRTLRRAARWAPAGRRGRRRSDQVHLRQPGATATDRRARGDRGAAVVDDAARRARFPRQARTPVGAADGPAVCARWRAGGSGQDLLEHRCLHRRFAVPDVGDRSRRWRRPTARGPTSTPSSSPAVPAPTSGRRDRRRRRHDRTAVPASPTWAWCLASTTTTPRSSSGSTSLRRRRRGRFSRTCRVGPNSASRPPQSFATDSRRRRSRPADNVIAAVAAATHAAAPTNETRRDVVSDRESEAGAGAMSPRRRRPLGSDSVGAHRRQRVDDAVAHPGIPPGGRVVRGVLDPAHHLPRRQLGRHRPDQRGDARHHRRRVAGARNRLGAQTNPATDVDQPVAVRAEGHDRLAGRGDVDPRARQRERRRPARAVDRADGQHVVVVPRRAHHDVHGVPVRADRDGPGSGAGFCRGH